MHASDLLFASIAGACVVEMKSSSARSRTQTPPQNQFLFIAANSQAFPGAVHPLHEGAAREFVPDNPAD